MGSTAPDRRLTAEEFAALPEAGHAELVRGDIVEEGMTTLTHGNLSYLVARAIDDWAGGQGRVYVNSSFTLSRDPDTVRRPDVSFVFSERLVDIDESHGYPELAPDLAVEILSPNDKPDLQAERVADYLAAGVRLVWVLNSFERHIISYGPGQPTRIHPAGSNLDGGEVLPGFTALVDTLLS